MPSAASVNPLPLIAVASPPAAPVVAAVTSYVEAAMDPWVHLLATAEQDLSNAYSLLRQEVSQVVANVRQEWYQFLGINPNAQNPAFGTAEQQAGNDLASSGGISMGRGSSRGSGSGGSATTTNNSQNPPNNTTTQPNGSGSGSGGSAASSAQGNTSKTGGSKILPMTGSGGGSCGSGATTVQFSQGSTTVSEESGSCGSANMVSIPVYLSNTPPYTVTVKYATSDNTAIAGTDYTAENSTLTFMPGQNVQYIKIPILDDGDDESGGNQSFFVNLSSPMCAKLGGATQFVVFVAEGPQQKAGDILRWVPCMGNNASNEQNWYDMSQAKPFRLQKGAEGPNATTPIQFDANPQDAPIISNQPIIWDKTVTVASISLNQYTGKQTINGGIKVESNGANGTALTMDGSSNLYQYYNSGATFQVDNNSTINNMKLVGDPTGQFIINGGITQIAQAPGYTETVGVNIIINSGATLYDQGQNALLFTNDNLQIVVYGTMQVSNGPNATNTLIDNGGNVDDFINVYGGTLIYTGLVGVTDTFIMPIQVQKGGTFIVTSLADFSGGKLIVQGITTSPGGIKASVEVFDSISAVQLSNRTTLQCNNDYYQSLGTLKTMDDSTCTLVDGSAGGGTANIASGYLIIDQPKKGYGTLNVNCGTLIFAGMYVLSINAQAQGVGSCDLLNVSGTTNLQGASLAVIVNNTPPPPPAGSKWLIINDTGGKAIQNGGNLPITTSPNTNLNGSVNNNQYLLSF